MSKIISPKTIALTFGVLVIIFLAAFYISAWTEPSGTPPTSNASTTINVSANPQIKEGALQVNGFKNVGTTDVSGNKIINLAEPTANSDAATKGYVDAKLGGSGGGGGGLDFYQTPGTYNGANADTACVSGYHMCLLDEQTGRSYNTSLGADGNLDNASWVDTNSNIFSVIGVGSCTADYRADCGNWTVGQPNTIACGTQYFTASGRTAAINNNSYSSIPYGTYTYGYGMCSGAAPVLCCENNNSEIGAEQAATSFSNAATYCRNLGGSWHLPSVEELNYYAGLSGASGNYLWTSTKGASNNAVSVVILNPYFMSDGTPGGSYAQTLNFRCVR
jgi:hypothetical protein